MKLKLYETKYGDLYHLITDTCIAVSLEKYGEWAEEEISLLRNYVTKGCVVVDIGANIGTHSLAFSRLVGEEGLVLSIEAQHQIYQLLSVNMIINNVSNVVPIHALVGESEEVKYYRVRNKDEDKNYGAVSFIDKEEPNANEGSILLTPVSKTSVDKLNLNKCDVIKIDVEGMEYEVLKSAESTIEKHKPIIYFEAYMTPVYSKIIKFLKERGYRMYWHIAPAFNVKNYFHCSDNIFGESGDRNILALHGGKTPDVIPGPEVTSTEYPDDEELQNLVPRLFCKNQEEKFQKRLIDTRKKSDALIEGLLNLEEKFEDLLQDRIKAQEIIEYLSKK